MDLLRRFAGFKVLEYFLIHPSGEMHLRSLARELQEDLAREVQITVIPPLRWEMMKKGGDRFAESVLKNHVLIKGGAL
jgi:hypothetical protein